jgi:soluble lytic murein transglycosylase
MYDPATNIQLGTDFLSYLVNRFDGNLYLALAGYNGGPNRVSSYLNNWYNGNLKNVDIDEFVESIPLRETRLYVQKVMESYYQYKRIYGQG